MKPGPRFTILALLLGALLAVSAFLQSYGAKDTESKPSIASDKPSGTSALASLLRASGFEVVHERKAKPKLRKEDLLVTFSTNVRRRNPIFDAQKSFDLPPDPFLKQLHEHVEQGGRLLFLEMPENFQEASIEAQKSAPRKIKDSLLGRNYSITSSFKVDLVGMNIKETSPSTVSVWNDGTEPFAVACRHENGIEVVAGNSLFLTNRFLDKGENARAALDLFRAAHQTRKRIVFLENVLDPEPPVTLVSALGPWSAAVWYQVLFLFLLVIVTLNRPFGLPSEMRPPMRGARDLVDGLADTMVRGRLARMAMEIHLNSTLTQVRRKLRLSPDSRVNVEDPRIPPDLQAALTRAIGLQMAEKPKTQDFLQESAALIKALDESEFSPRKSAPPTSTQ